MNPQDLITQVRAPGEEDDASAKRQVPQENTANTANTTGNQGGESSSCLCCKAQDPHGNNQGGQAQAPAKKMSIGVQAAGNKYPDRSTINSPRIGDSGMAGQKAPWRDDHLLPPAKDHKKGMKCLVLDLDETLVHSSFKPVESCDFVIPVEIEEHVHQVYVCKRPHVDEFMKRCGEIYEIVIFTASLAKYADPVLDLLDVHKVIDWRLFRESCSPFKGSYVKDMGRMGRDLSKIMIIDNSPHSYAFNPENAIPCESWFSDKNDTELLELIPVLEELSKDGVMDVREKLKELKISGLDALKKELAGGESEYTTDDSEFETDSEEKKNGKLRQIP